MRMLQTRNVEISIEEVKQSKEEEKRNNVNYNWFHLNLMNLMAYKIYFFFLKSILNYFHCFESVCLHMMCVCVCFFFVGNYFWSNENKNALFSLRFFIFIKRKRNM